ncbi:MAG TPA: DUF1559 domain-containing protein, partial [Gemmataceae bacterium]
ICVSTNIPKMPCTTTSTPSRPRLMGARSLHTGGGVNAAMCDGSVTFIRDTINIATWQALGSAQGQESVTLDF